MKKSSLCFLILTAALSFQSAFAANVRCPRYMAVLEGMSQMPYGVTYRERIEMHKIGNGAGLQGKWQIDEYEQENVYPFSGPIHFALDTNVPFGLGQSMKCAGEVSGNKFHNLCREGNLTLDVVGNRIGSTATGVWVGKVEGNKMTIKFDKSNPYSPDTTGEVFSLDSGQLDLRISTADGKTDLVFDAQPTGRLSTTLKADVTPAQYSDRVEWSLFDIQGSQRKIMPATAIGKEIKLEFTGLPQKNSAFGKKTVFAKVRIASCEVSDSKEIRVFYPRDAKNNPKHTPPNWFYYWSQTSACPGPASWGDPANACGTPENRADGALGYYRNTYLDDKYYICDFAKLGSDFEFETVQLKNGGFDSAKVKGIDTMGAACHHENGHFTHFRDWWFVHRANHPFSPTEDFNKNSIKDSVENQFDQDGDLVPDAVETTLGLDPTKKKTLMQYGVDLDDEEYLAWVAEGKWRIGSADGEDWACPGKQCPK
jgi:hypothetical protein